MNDLQKGTSRMQACLSGLLLKAFVLLIRMYQLFISPIKLFLFGASSSCRFYPSCSTYAKDSFIRFGIVKGTYLTINRICRCHPWNEGGVDPVPHKGCDTCK